MGWLAATDGYEVALVDRKLACRRSADGRLSAGQQRAGGARLRRAVDDSWLAAS